MSARKFRRLIIGSGAAGLPRADLRPSCASPCSPKASFRPAPPPGRRAASRGAGGGDTFERHIEDTIVAGAGLNHRASVEFVVENAPAAIERLAALGVPFNAGRGPLAPDARGRAQPSPHRPRRRRDRLGGAAGAGERRRRTRTSPVPDMVRST
jgi:L-aspartate oxidase